MQRVVVLGAGMAGLRTAESLRRHGYDGELVVVGAEAHLPYNRPPLSKEVLADEVSHGAVAFPLRAALDTVPQSSKGVAGSGPGPPLGWLTAAGLAGLLGIWLGRRWKTIGRYRSRSIRS